MRSTTLKWIGLALLGIVIAAGVAVAASSLASHQIGLASEPISAGDALAPVADPCRPHAKGRAADLESPDEHRTLDLAAADGIHPDPAGIDPPRTRTDAHSALGRPRRRRRLGRRRWLRWGRRSRRLSSGRRCGLAPRCGRLARTWMGDDVGYRQLDGAPQAIRQAESQPA